MNIKTTNAVIVEVHFNHQELTPKQNDDLQNAAWNSNAIVTSLQPGNFHLILLTDDAQRLINTIQTLNIQDDKT